MEVSENIKKIIPTLPDSPGVYQYFNKNGEIIYVGKAKKLKKRVASYFTKHHDSAKTRILVRKIFDIKYILVETEADALLLENNLVKKHQPRYNVLLKDDKSFPWICIKNERFPRVFSTRRIVKDGSAYFGPYTSVSMVNTLLDLFKQLFKLRNCNYELSEANILAQKFKVCLEYHIGNCKAPCINKQTEKEYNLQIHQIKKILKGNISSVVSFLKQTMQQLAEVYKFEEANEIKNKIELLQHYQSKSTIVSNSINNVDIFGIVDDKKYAYVNFLKVVNGAIIQAHTVEMTKRLDETKEDLLPVAIIDIRQRFFSNAKEIIIPFNVDYTIKDSKFIIPKIGDKKKLLDLSLRNAKYYRQEKLREYEKIHPENRILRILETIKKDFRLHELPRHIECFDNSNMQGSNPVAACVVFRNAKPSKKEYRHFHVKTVEGPNDFASMEEIVYRRYKRLLDEEQDLPNLIVIDGGKGQLGAALNALEKIELRGKIPIVGIAKRLEEIFFPGDSIPIYLDKNSESLKIVQHIRNEAHRFGITFHRNLRSKKFINSELLNINGVGEKTLQKLLASMKSVDKIKQASIDELAGQIGRSKAILVFQHFHPESEKELK